jgi:hypothetical protein
LDAYSGANIRKGIARGRKNAPGATKELVGTVTGSYFPKDTEYYKNHNNLA